MGAIPWGFHPEPANSFIVWTATFRNIPALMASGRRQYPFHLIEPKWQRCWDEQQAWAWNRCLGRLVGALLQNEAGREPGWELACGQQRQVEILCCPGEPDQVIVRPQKSE